MSRKISPEQKKLNRKLYNESYSVENKEKILAKAKEYRERPDVKAKRALWRKDNREYLKKYNEENRKHKKFYKIKRTYGLSIEEYEKMCEQQGMKCGICVKVLDFTLGSGTHVDHDHKTGKVRGILCRSCNLLLGYSYDNEKTLYSAVKYLRNNI